MGLQTYRSDAGSKITAEVITQKDFLPSIGGPDDEKILQYLYVFLEPISTVRLFIKYNDGDWEELGSVKSYPQKFDLGHKKVRYIQLKLVESSTNKAFVWEGYLVVGSVAEQRV